MGMIKVHPLTSRHREREARGDPCILCFHGQRIHCNNTWIASSSAYAKGSGGIPRNDSPMHFGA